MGLGAQVDRDARSTEATGGAVARLLKKEDEDGRDLARMPADCRLFVAVLVLVLDMLEGRVAGAAIVLVGGEL